MNTAETAAVPVPQTGAAARTERRATVRHLAHQEGLSARAIAARLGISKDTVRRDLADVAQGGAPDDAPPATSGAPVAPPRAPGGAVAHSGRPDQAGGHVADRGGVFVPFREGLGSDLADLMRTGCTAADAIDYAVTTLAAAYRGALELGVLSDSDPLDVLAVTFRPPARAATAAR